MRLRRKMIDYVAQTVTDHVLDEKLLGVEGPVETLTAEIRRLITDFTQESDELTPTLKVKRQVVTEKYQTRLDHLYEED